MVDDMAKLGQRCAASYIADSIRLASILPGNPFLHYVRHRTDPICFFDYIFQMVSIRRAGKGRTALLRCVGFVGRKPGAGSFFTHIWRIKHEQI